jgi:hypothetical protein
MMDEIAEVICVVTIVCLACFACGVVVGKMLARK